MIKKHSHVWKILIFDMFIIEFGPVGVFFIAYYFYDFLTAALALGTSTFLALTASRIVNKRVPWFAIFSGVITMITAGVTFWYNLPWLLIFKDTVYYLFFAAILGVSLVIKKYIFKVFFGHVFVISYVGWRELEKRWLYFFVFAGVSNEVVRIFLTPDEWVIYKQVMVVIFLIFGLYQFRISSKHRMPGSDKLGLRISVAE